MRKIFTTGKPSRYHAHQMDLDEKIENLLLEVYAIMPSLGTYPFTAITVARTALDSSTTKSLLIPSNQLLILKRTDFSQDEWIDYIVNTKEYETIPLENRKAFLSANRHASADEAVMMQWCDRVISLGVGIIMGLAHNKGISLIPVEADLATLDIHFGFHTKNLQIYQLFDISANS